MCTCDNYIGVVIMPVVTDTRLEMRYYVQSDGSQEMSLLAYNLILYSTRITLSKNYSGVFFSLMD